MTPEAVAQAMKVLEIHERLEHPDHAAVSGKPADRLGDNEVDVLKEMCNVSTMVVVDAVFAFTQKSCIYTYKSSVGHANTGLEPLKCQS